METLEFLCSELISSVDSRAEFAASKFKEYGFSGLEALRTLYNSSDDDTRWWVIRAFSCFETISEVIPDLQKGMRDTSPDVRQAAALSLIHKPWPSSALILIEGISDKDPLVARLSSCALAALGKDVSVSLLEVLENGKLTARLEAIRALAEITDTKTIPAIMKYLDDDSALIQYWSKEALEKMGVGMIYLDPSRD